MSEKKVTVFSTPTCPYCVMVKDYLKDKKVEFKDVNVAADQEMAMKMFNRSHNMGVPQVWVGKDVVIGFDPNTIDDLLKAKQK